MTEHENRFFRIAILTAEKCLNDEIAPYDTYWDCAEPFHPLADRFIDEIRDNCTQLTGNEKIIYMDRLEDRLINILEELPISSKRTKEYYSDLAYPVEAVLEKLRSFKEIYKQNDGSVTNTINHVANLSDLPTIRDAKVEILTRDLAKYGFFQLDQTMLLSEKGKQNLVALIASNKTPYIIAMFEYLGFLRELEKKYFKTKVEMYKNISIWLGYKTSDDIKKYIRSMNRKSKIDRERYNAPKYIDLVQKDCEIIKKGGIPTF